MRGHPVNPGRRNARGHPANPDQRGDTPECRGMHRNVGCPCAK